MSYRLEQNNLTGEDELVIDGFENGISDSPYQGIIDMRNANIISVPGEAAVGFKTTAQTLPSATGTFTADVANNVIVPTTNNLQVYHAVTFTTTNTLPAGLSTNTVYWIASGVTVNDWKVYSKANPSVSSLVTISSTGTGVHTYTTVDMNEPRYIEPQTGTFLIDTSGRVWFSVSSVWSFAGNTTLTNANGNGILAYKGYILVFRNSQIDYLNNYGTTDYTWVYGWVPSSGATGSTSGILRTLIGANNPHQPVISQTDKTIYFPDGDYIDTLIEKAGQTFTPTNTATYTYSSGALILPPNEVSQCNAILGTNLLIGSGTDNLVYSWDRTSSGYLPIYIAEKGVFNILTINTNAYLFAGFRGRIYITNGSQAQLWKKVPDHISGTIEPYFTWKGAATGRNQIYFGVKATANADTTTVLAKYGGVWAIDVDTRAIREVNKLSYGTYNGYASAIYASNTTGAGFALTIGWNSGASTYGVDVSSSNVYTSGETEIVSDIIPVGSSIRPKTFQQIEYKLSRPLVSGESVALSAGSNINDYFSSTWSTIGTDSTVGNLSYAFPFPTENQQWLIIRTILTGTNTSPSFVRLRELRLR